VPFCLIPKLTTFAKTKNMKFKVGDKVKFLNETGGGIVSKILSSNMVHITIEDGFEIPILTNEIIKIDEYSGAFVEKSFREMELPKASDIENADTYTERSSELISMRSRDPFPEGIYIALVPQDQKWLITGLLDLYLINFSENTLLFSLLLKNKDGHFESLDYDAIQPKSKVIIDSIEREAIEEWKEGVIQILFHPDKADHILMPVTVDYKFNPVKLYKEASYRSSAFLQEKAYIIKIHSVSDSRPICHDEKSLKYEDNTMTKKAVEAKPIAIIDRHKIDTGIAEVDLHISALKEDFTGLSNHQILQIQTKYFSKCLDSALENHYFKIIAIHGIGNGTLKKALTEILKDFGGLEFMDASFRKYGAGAIDIRIPDNR